jgi:predicted transcriptional regulator
MKHFFLILACVLLLFTEFGCGQYDKSKRIEQYKYEEDISVLNVKFKPEMGKWLKEGRICYGIVIVCDENKVPIRLKEVQAKVITINSDKITMQTLENVPINHSINCNKVALKKGEFWDEVDGELYKTREEAILYIDDKYPGLRMKY